MKAQRLFELIGLVDEDLVENALKPPVRRRFPLAAAACLVLCALSLPLLSGIFSPKGAQMESAPAAPEAEAPSAPAEGFSFLSYSGPILPLILPEVTGLDVSRDLTLSIADHAAEVTDRYLFTNNSGHDISLTALYPVCGSLSALDQILPVLTVNGAAAESTLHAGQYAGSFVSAYGSDDDTRRDNLLQPSSWDHYDKLLQDKDDAGYALVPMANLNDRVTVYEFSEFVTRTDYDAATLAVEFEIDPDATTVMTYGFNGGTWDGSWRQYDFFVPNGIRRDISPKLLILRGEDLESYQLAGYTDGSCEEPLTGLSCRVERYESDMGTVLERLCQTYLDKHASGIDISGILRSDPANIPPELFVRCAAEILTEYGVLSESAAERYEFGRLDEVIHEALIMERIFYTVFEVSLPAGESLSVALDSRKAESFNFPGTKRSGITGYDLLTDDLPTILTIDGVNPEQLGNNNLPAPQTSPAPYYHYYFEIES